MECVEWEERARAADPARAVPRRRSRALALTVGLALASTGIAVVATVLAAA